MISQSTKLSPRLRSEMLCAGATLAIFVTMFRTLSHIVSEFAPHQQIFGTLGLIARLRGYRATYPQLSRTVMAPRA